MTKAFFGVMTSRKSFLTAAIYIEGLTRLKALGQKGVELY